MKLLLLGRFAFTQSREDPGARVHQTVVGLVLVSFDFADVEESIRAVRTVLRCRITSQKMQNANAKNKKLNQSHAVTVIIPGRRRSGIHIRWACSRASGPGPHTDLESDH